MKLTRRKFFDGIEVLEQNGRRDLSGVCWMFYKQMTKGCITDGEERQAEAFLNRVFGDALLNPKSIPPEAILLSPDFTFLRAMAQLMLNFGLVDGGVYEITDEELEEA